MVTKGTHWLDWLRRVAKIRSVPPEEGDSFPSNNIAAWHCNLDLRKYLLFLLLVCGDDGKKGELKGFFARLLSFGHFPRKSLIRDCSLQVQLFIFLLPTYWVILIIIYKLSIILHCNAVSLSIPSTISALGSIVRRTRHSLSHGILMLISTLLLP